MPENLTIESLARILHEDQQKATRRFLYGAENHPRFCAVFKSFEYLTGNEQAVRREQARLLLERIRHEDQNRKEQDHG